MRTKRSAVALLLVLAIALAGCATLGIGKAPGKNLAEMNAKERSLYFMATYKAQFKDAESMGGLAVAGKLSPERLEVYRAKRKLLVQVKPLIEAYDLIASGGLTPAADKEQEIIDILTDLATKFAGSL